VLCGAIMLSATRLIVKKVSKEDTAPTIVALMTIIITPISLVPALFVWTWPDLEVLAMLVLIAGLGTLTHLLMSQAIRDGDLTQIEPVMFTRLIWAGLFGYILFAEIPTLWTWIGAAVIVVSTTALVRSEARRKASELPLE
jgi:drug/metabolite transporter (DMT)-like permease